MTRMTGPDCAVMYNLINIHTHTLRNEVSFIPPWEDQREWHRMTRMTRRPESAVLCNLINTHTHTHAHTHAQTHTHTYSSGVHTRAQTLIGYFVSD